MSKPGKLKRAELENMSTSSLQALCVRLEREGKTLIKDLENIEEENKMITVALTEDLEYQAKKKRKSKKKKGEKQEETKDTGKIQTDLVDAFALATVPQTYAWDVPNGNQQLTKEKLGKKDKGQNMTEKEKLEYF